MEPPPGALEPEFLAGLKSEAIYSADGTFHDFNVGCLAGFEGFPEVVSVAIIACVEDRFLVTIPGAAWHR